MHIMLLKQILCRTDRLDKALKMAPVLDVLL